MEELTPYLKDFPRELRDALEETAMLRSFEAGQEILREGQYVQVVPLVLKGVVKVYMRQGEKELLLYYIHQRESCVMSLSAGLWQTPSKVFALAEQDSEILLLPVDVLRPWLQKYPYLQELFFQQFNQRYEDLLQTLSGVLFDQMDQRVYDYLIRKAEVSGQGVLNIKHHEIAHDLGTAREVISRVLKRLEGEGKVKASHGKIEIIEQM